MSDTALLLRLGAQVNCTDGARGEVRGLVIDPADDAVTHFVAEERHRQGLGQLVPFGQVRSATAEAVQLRCSTAEFDQFAPADETQFLPGTRGYQDYGPEQVISWPYQGGRGGEPGVQAGSVPWVSETATAELIPEGETEIPRGERVHATDGDIGQVRGILVDPGNRHVTHVLLQEGHLWGRKEVRIPRDAVARVDQDGFHLSLTRQDVQDLHAGRGTSGE